MHPQTEISNNKILQYWEYDTTRWDDFMCS